MSEPIHHLTRGELIAAGTHTESLASSSAAITPESGAMPLVGSGGGLGASAPTVSINWGLRRQVAERLLDFWQHEFATHNDGNARVQMDRAHAMLGDVNQGRHQSSPNNRDEPTPASGGKPKEKQ